MWGYFIVEYLSSLPETPFHELGTGASIVIGSFLTGWMKHILRA